MAKQPQFTQAHKQAIDDLDFFRRSFVTEFESLFTSPLGLDARLQALETRLQALEKFHKKFFKADGE
ncbi:hypothetical protein LTR97_007703 [Elasticomyces elasticus]|uniref:Uncharacterized protein n=1 Tax=Elasticomyces elasticus TaxID=574655 RepID=A0AAN7WF18_9PEZI|nr:hypothetical protein LTR97_007703 [Elasticomyces elasticus]KAK5727588.1 hypothetical protein LTR15_003489 [Elasticomyces elasticus]